MGILNDGDQFGILLMACGGLALLPSIKTTATNIQNLTQQGYRMGLLLGINQLIPFPDSFAKKAAAFFKISRSCFNR